MNTDIRLSVEFWQHPKTYRLEKRIGLKGVRSLQILWCWCAKNRPDGNLEGLDVDEIEFVADWRGKKGAFVEACIGSWLDQTDSGFCLHEWAEYNPYQALAGDREEARREKARKAANARWQKSSSNNANECSNNATSNAQAYANDSSSTCLDTEQAMLEQCSNNATSNAQAMPTSTLTSTRIKDNLNTPPYTPQRGEAVPVSDSEIPEKLEKAHQAEALPQTKTDSNQEQRQKTSAKYTQDFETFWVAYPRKVGKDQAFKIWKRRKRDLPPLEELSSILARQCHCEQWQRDGGQYIPHPATWLSQGRWQDSPENNQGWTPKPANW